MQLQQQPRGPPLRPTLWQESLFGGMDGPQQAPFKWACFSDMETETEKREEIKDFTEGNELGEAEWNVKKAE